MQQFQWIFKNYFNVFGKKWQFDGNKFTFSKWNVSHICLRANIPIYILKKMVIDWMAFHKCHFIVFSLHHSEQSISSVEFTEILSSFQLNNYYEVRWFAICHAQRCYKSYLLQKQQSMFFDYTIPLTSEYWYLWQCPSQPNSWIQTEKWIYFLMDVVVIVGTATVKASACGGCGFNNCFFYSLRYIRMQTQLPILHVVHAIQGRMCSSTPSENTAWKFHPSLSDSSFMPARTTYVCKQVRYARLFYM